MNIITDINYFKEKFKTLKFRSFDDDTQMKNFLEKVYKSEDVLNSLILDRLAELEEKIEWLQTQSYYESERNYVIEFHDSLKKVTINSLSDLEDASKKVDRLINQSAQVYDKVLRKVHRHRETDTLQDTINYILNDNKITLTDEEKVTIQSFKIQLEAIRNAQDFKLEDVENISNYLNNISAKTFNQYQTDPQSFINGKSFMFTVHNLTSYTNLKATDEFYRKNFISTSLITDKEMGLYGQNKVGFIYPVDGNVVAAESKDVYSYNTKDDDSQIFIGKYDKPTIKPSTQIEQECMQKSIEETGEILNYCAIDSNGYYKDQTRAYSEVVLDIRNTKPTGIFCITNGEKELNSNYVEAKRLSDEFNLPLVDIDMSVYRIKNGLTPITENDKIQLTTNMLYFYYKELGQDADYVNRITMAQKYSNQISESLMLLKKDGQYSIEAMIYVLKNILTDSYDYSVSKNTQKKV